MAVTQPTYDETEMDALDGTTDPETGIYYIPWAYPAKGTPPVKVKLTQQQKHINNLLRMIAPGVVINRNDGLNVCVLGIPRYRIGGTSYTLPDDNVFACSDDSTCYLYCDDSEVVEESTTGWPVTDHIKLAVVTTASGEVAAVKPALLENHTIGIDNDWSAIDAIEDVDFADYDAENVGEVRYTTKSDVTIASGAITPTQMFHTVRSEGGAGTDDLTTINGTVDEQRLLVLFGMSPAEQITIKETDNIFLRHPTELILENELYWIMFMQIKSSGSVYWYEVARCTEEVLRGEDIDMAGSEIKDIGEFGYIWPLSTTISSGAIAYSGKSIYVLEAETSTADDLDTITGMALGQLCILVPTSGHTITVKHGTGANQIELSNGVDFIMSAPEHVLVVMLTAGGIRELYRSPMHLAALEATEYCIPYSVCFNAPGALSAKVYEQEMLLPVSGKIRTATGRVTTAPSGGLCYVDVQLDTGGGFGSIFAAGDANKIAIADGEYEDTATVIDPWCAFSAGDRLRIEVVATGGSPNGAADLHVMVDARCAVQAPE